VLDADSGGSPSYVRVFVRALMAYLSGLVLVLGYLGMLWDRRKQTWHDKVADSVVVRASAYPPGESAKALDREVHQIDTPRSPALPRPPARPLAHDATLPRKAGVAPKVVSSWRGLRRAKSVRPPRPACPGTTCASGAREHHAGQAVGAVGIEPTLTPGLSRRPLPIGLRPPSDQTVQRWRVGGEVGEVEVADQGEEAGAE
jgi:RDD family